MILVIPVLENHDAAIEFQRRLVAESALTGRKVPDELLHILRLKVRPREAIAGLPSGAPSVEDVHVVDRHACPSESPRIRLVARHG